jgi:hypothetical protein
MSDEFKSIARKVEPAPDPYEPRADKPMSRRVARARMKAELRKRIREAATPEASLRAGPEAVAISLAIGRHLKPGYLVGVDVPGHGAWTVTRERDGTYSATQSRLRATLRGAFDE